MDTISKKELLAQTGISYGQLYRWKREGLIPEEWFVKQSSFTGQETFFPREKVLDRVAVILKMKDNCSLEELARLLAPSAVVSVAAEAAAKITEIAHWLLPRDSEREYTVAELAFLAGLSSANLSREDATALAQRGHEALGSLRGEGYRVTIIDTGENLHLCFTAGDTLPVFDGAVKTAAEFPLGELAEKIRTDYPYLLKGEQ